MNQGYYRLANGNISLYTPPTSDYEKRLLESRFAGATYLGNSYGGSTAPVSTPASSATPTPVSTPISTQTPIQTSTPISSATPTPASTSIQTPEQIASATRAAQAAGFGSIEEARIGLKSRTDVNALKSALDTANANYRSTGAGYGEMVNAQKAYDNALSYANPVQTSEQLAGAERAAKELGFRSVEGARTALSSYTPPSSLSTENINETSPINYNSPLYVPPPSVSGLNSDTSYLQTTPQEKEATGLSQRISELNARLTGESAYRTEQETTQGIPQLKRAQTDLSVQLKTLQNEAAAIPLQLEQEATGRGITTALLGRQENSRLRTNAIAALGVSSLLEASRGNLASALDLVDRAVAAKFDPIREEINATTSNLKLLLERPDTALADKNRAIQQLEIQTQKKAAVEKAADDQTEIYKIAVEAVKNGLTDSVLMNKIRNARTPLEALDLASQFMAKPKEKAGFELSAGQTRYEFDPKTGKAVAVASMAARATGGGLSANIPNEYNNAFNSLSARMTKDEAERATEYFNQLMSSGDTKTAQEYLKTTAIANLPATEQTKAFGRFAAIDSLVSVKQDLADFVAKGGNTGLLTGTEESIAQKLGRTTNVEAARIGNEILLAMIAYRNAVSGAAFTESEQKQYIQVFPSIGKIPELNNAKIQSLLDTFNRNNKSIFGQVLGSGNYDKIFGSPVVDLTRLNFTFGNTQTSVPKLTLNSQSSPYVSLSNSLTSEGNSLSTLNFKF